MELETTINQEVKYISYGHDPKFFKIMGKDLYYNTGSIEKPKYEMLRRDYNVSKN